jgi:hypothetical protein
MARSLIALGRRSKTTPFVGEGKFAGAVLMFAEIKACVRI